MAAKYKKMNTQENYHEVLIRNHVVVKFIAMPSTFTHIPSITMSIALYRDMFPHDDLDYEGLFSLLPVSVTPTATRGIWVLNPAVEWGK